MASGQVSERVDRVLDRDPEAMNPDPLEAYVWLDMPGKVRHVAAADS
jgi:hypothetical protein